MNALYKRLAERIDAATLRERALIFAAATLALVALANALWIDPALRRERQLSARIAQNQGEIATVQAQIQALVRARQADPDGVSRQRLAAIKSELAQLERAIVELQRRLATPERMREVLEGMLERNRRLRLVDLRTLPLGTLSEGAQRQIYRHGVELAVAGSYADLYQYLLELERLPTQVYWGRAELSAAGHPEIVLRLTVYTLSLDPSWIVV